jgi:hypothetical protein
MSVFRLFIPLLFTCCTATTLLAQSDKEQMAATQLIGRDTSISLKDSTQKIATAKKHIPKIATRRSWLIPGWGQAYNKQYWKIPVVYGILAIPTVAYVYNNSMYKKTKFAYEALFKAQLPPPNNDSTDYRLIDPQLRGLSISSVQSYRNTFRRDRDYSILWFLLAWGLQVADATVFAHLKEFDVSDDLTMQISPTFNPQTRTPGFGLVMSLKNPDKKPKQVR